MEELALLLPRRLYATDQIAWLRSATHRLIERFNHSTRAHVEVRRLMEGECRAVRANTIHLEGKMVYLILVIDAIAEPHMERSSVARLARTIWHKDKITGLVACVPEVAVFVDGEVEHAVVGDGERSGRVGARVIAWEGVNGIVERLGERRRAVAISERACHRQKQQTHNGDEYQTASKQQAFPHLHRTRTFLQHDLICEMLR